MYSWPKSFSSWTDAAIAVNQWSAGVRPGLPGPLRQLANYPMSMTGSVRSRYSTVMRLGSHLPIPRNLHSAPQRLPRPFLLSIAGASRHSLNPINVPACTPYSPLYNSTLASTPTTSAHEDSNVINQRVPSKSSQSTPMLEYNKLVEAGTLRSDDYQTQIIQKLQALHESLVLYDPPPPAGPPSLVNISPFPFSRTLLTLLTPPALTPFLPSHTECYEPRQTKGIVPLW